MKYYYTLVVFDDDEFLKNCRYFCHCPGLVFINLLEGAEGLPSQGRRNGWILKTAYCLGNYIGTDDWHCPCIRSRCCIHYTSYIVLSKAQNTTYGGIPWYCTTECIVLQTRSHANRCQCNGGVQLYKRLKLKINMY